METRAASAHAYLDRSQMLSPADEQALVHAMSARLAMRRRVTDEARLAA